MSFRSSLTKLVASLSSARNAVPCTGVAVVGLLVASAVAGGGCDNSSLTPCPPNIGSGMCICNSYGCSPANPTGTGGAGGNSSIISSSSSSGTTTTTTTSSSSSSSACDPSMAACPCDNGMCSGGLNCVNNLCINGCNFTYECGSGKVCENGACVPGCDMTHGCATGYTCSNGACQPDPANPQCSTSNPCPSPQICQSGICTSQCNSNSDCMSGQVCDGGTHTCIANPSPTPVCNNSMPCPGTELCLNDGFCHYPCTGLQQCKLIDNRFVACGMVNGQNVCETQEEVSPQCTLTMPCPPGKTCISNTCF